MSYGIKGRPYQDLLEFSAKWGHGVFCIPQAGSRIQQDNLWQFIKNNRDLFDSYSAGPAFTNIFLLKKLFYKRKGFHIKRTGAESYGKIKDICLLNSFLYENEIEADYKITPHLFCYDPKNDLKIGIISSSLGVSNRLSDIDILLSTKRTKAHYRENTEIIQKVAKKQRTSPLQVEKLFSNIIVPKAFKYFLEQTTYEA